MGFGFFSPPDYDLIFLVSGSSPLGIMLGDVMFCSLFTFDTFLVLSRHVFLELMNNQNS